MHFFDDYLYRKYMTDEMDEEEFVKRLQVAFEQEAKLYPEKKELIYEGKDAELIYLVCEEYLSTLAFKKEVGAIKVDTMEREITKSPISEDETDTNNEDVLEEIKPALEVVENEESPEKLYAAADKKKLAKKMALKKRQLALNETFAKQANQTEMKRLMDAYKKRQEAIATYEKINNEGHFHFDEKKHPKKEERKPVTDKEVPISNTQRIQNKTPHVASMIRYAKDAPKQEQNALRETKKTPTNEQRMQQIHRLAYARQIKYEKEKAATSNFYEGITVNKNNTYQKSRDISGFNTDQRTHSRAQDPKQATIIGQRKASALTERFHTFHERAKSTKNVANRVLNGLGYTNFTYRISYSARHYLTSQMRSGDETRDIVTLTDSMSSAARISYSLMCATSFGKISGQRRTAIDKATKELTKNQVSHLKQTLKMKKQELLKNKRTGSTTYKPPGNVSIAYTAGGAAVLKNERSLLWQNYVTERFVLENPIRMRIKKALRKTEALNELLAEFKTKGQDISSLKKELKLLLTKKRRGIITTEELERLTKLRVSILLKKAHETGYKNKVRPRSLLYSIMALARRAAAKSQETGMEGLLKLVDIGTNIYLYKTLKTFYKTSIFFTKKGIKVTRYLGKQYLNKTKSGVAMKASAKKVSSKITTLTKKITTLKKPAIKTASTTKGGIVALRGAKKAKTAGKMTVLGTTKAMSLPAKFLSAVTFVPRKLVMVFQAVSAVFSKVLLYIGAALLAFILVCVLIEALSSAFFMILGEDEKDGKIDLSPYVSVIEKESVAFSETVSKMTTRTASNGTEYENVYYNLSTTDNTKEILSMTAVRFGNDLSMEHTIEEVKEGVCDHVEHKDGDMICAGHTDEVESYIKSLYHASHLLYTTESQPYDCRNTDTCTHKVKKTDTEYEFVSFTKMTKDELKNLDLKDYVDVRFDKNDNPLYGYKKKKVISYHCPGDHVDVTVSSSVLTFDTIFATDDIAYSGLGDVAFSFESASDPWMCVDDSALKDGSGFNYGLPSMTYASGSIQNFMQYLSTYDKELYQAFDGLKPGTDAFNDKWKNNNWSADETNRMINAQRSFAWMQYGSVAVTKCMDLTGVDLSRSKALMEVAISRGLNNPTTDWYSGAGIKSSMSDKEIVTVLYDHIYKNIETFWPGQTQNHNGLKNRMQKEKALVLALCDATNKPETDTSSWEGWSKDNIEWAKTIYEQDWDKLYVGYKEGTLNWGGSGIAIEIKEKEFEKILEVLNSKIGSPYVWGAVGPNTFDCSGLVKYVYETAGVYDFKGERPTTRTLYATCIPIAKEAAKQGDLIIWDVPGNIHHVAIYCGDGIVCHAPRTGDVVKFSRLWGNYGVFRLPEQ